MGNIYSEGIINNYKKVVNIFSQKNTEIQSLINQLKDESSDHLTILKNLGISLVNSVQDENYLGKTYLEMRFLDSVTKIFENEKDYDKNIVSLVVMIINKIDYKYYEIQGKEYLKPKDAIDPLFSIMIRYSTSIIKEDAIKLIVIISKKYPSDIFNNQRIKECYKYILPSNKEYSFENKKSIFLLFKEIVKEETIKQGEYGSMIIEELMFIVDKLEKKKNIFDIDKYLIDEGIDFFRIAKEKGFKKKPWKNKNEITTDFLFIDWKELCKDNKNNKPNHRKEEILKDEEKEKIKECLNNLIYERFLNHSYNVHIRFLYRLYDIILYSNTYSDDFDCFIGIKNDYFLYLFLPLIIKNYHFEEIFPDFIKSLQSYHYTGKDYFCYIEKLGEISTELLKESKEETEINEERVITLMFLWKVFYSSSRSNEELNCLIDNTVKVFEWLGRIEEEKEEEIKEKDKLSVKEECKTVDGMKGVINKNEMIMYKLLDIMSERIFVDIFSSTERVRKDRRLSEALLKIVKNHLKSEYSLIQKGNKKRITEYIIYSFDDNYKTSIPITITYHSFPFSNKTLIHILHCMKHFMLYEEYEKLKEKDILIDIIELLNNYIDIINITDGCNIKKEMEKETCQEWNEEIVNQLNGKIFLTSDCIEDISLKILYFIDFSSFDDEIKGRIKRLIILIFSHRNCYFHNNELVEDKDDKEMKDMILINLFSIEEYSREYLTRHFISYLTSKYCYSIIEYYDLTKMSDEGCDIIGILMKELSGEIVDRIKKREGMNIRKERRRYERERIDVIYFFILRSFECLFKHTFEDRNNIYLGFWKRRDSYDGKEEEVTEAYNYISEVLEEEDVRECIILFLTHLKEDNHCSYKEGTRLSGLSMMSNNALSYFLCSLIRIELQP